MGVLKPIARFRLNRAAVPPSPFLRIAFLFILSVFLTVLHIRENIWLMAARSFVTDRLHYLMTISSRPFLSLEYFQEQWHQLLKAKEENTFLHEKVQQLQYWHHTARVLMAENKKLRQALKVFPEKLSISLTAKINKVIDPRAGMQLILEAGLEQGLIKDQAVMAQGYLLGRLVEVYTKTSRILPITDPLSRIPVVLEVSHVKAILAGHPGGQLVLTHRQEDTSIVPGELAISSGEGGLFPAGLPIGMMEKSPSGEWCVIPLFNLKDLDIGHVLPLTPLTFYSNEQKTDEATP